MWPLHNRFDGLSERSGVHKGLHGALGAPYLDGVVHADKLDLLLDVGHLQIPLRNEEAPVAIKPDNLHVGDKLPENLLMLGVPAVEPAPSAD